MISSRPDVSTTGNNICLTVQKKSTPFKKPINNGGSPKGVNPPPILATKKIKKITVCTAYCRWRLARSNGRIINIAAPVVPIIEAKTTPTANKITFDFGVLILSLLIRMPPETVNSVKSSNIKGIYSSIMACTVNSIVVVNPKENNAEPKNENVQIATILP